MNRRVIWYSPSQPPIIRMSRPAALPRAPPNARKISVFRPDTKFVIMQAGQVSDTDNSPDSRVENVSGHSSLKSIEPISSASENSSDRTPNFFESTSLSSSPTDITSTFIKESLSQQDDINQVPIQTVSVADSDETALKEQVSSEFYNRNTSTLENQVWSCEYELCKYHGSRSRFFCWKCVYSGCYQCMKERHANHPVHNYITGQCLLLREKAYNEEMTACLKDIEREVHRLKHSYVIIVNTANKWQLEHGIQIDGLAQIQMDLESYLKGLNSIYMEAESKFKSFQRMMNRLGKMNCNRTLIEMLDDAERVCCQIIDLKCVNDSARKAVTDATSIQISSREILSARIKRLEMEIIKKSFMAPFEAESQLLYPECSIWPEVNNFDRRWEPRMPQPQPSTSTISMDSTYPAATTFSAF